MHISIPFVVLIAVRHIGIVCFLGFVAPGIIAFAAGCECTKHDAFDVVIIGGGLSGLSAAFQLRNKSVALLEKEARLGGRIFTKRNSGINYELGALFSYDGRWMPPGHTHSRIVSLNTQVGVSLSGHVTLDRSVDAVIKKIGETNTNFKSGGLIQHRSSRPYGYSLRETAKRAFFSVIHPGEIDEYIPARQGDWRVTFTADRFLYGNGELIDALEQESNARIFLSANATAVKSLSKRVKVDYTTNGKRKSLYARAAIVATPADVAVRLLGQTMADSPIKSIRYGAGVVVVLCVQGEGFVKFNYVVTPDLDISTVFSAPHGSGSVLTVYYAGEKARRVFKMPKTDVITKTVREINRSGIGFINEKHILFSDVHYWPSLGTIVKTVPYKDWNVELTRPTPRVFLAGDYTYWNNNKMPYGMKAAFDSGKVAGLAAKEFLDNLENTY